MKAPVNCPVVQDCSKPSKDTSTRQLRGTVFQMFAKISACIQKFFVGPFAQPIVEYGDRSL